jgi:hypothetical protein
MATLTTASACGDLKADAAPADEGPETAPYTGVWEDACEVFCERARQCHWDYDESVCLEDCVLAQAPLPESCEEDIGEVLWCTAALECEEITPMYDWRDATQFARSRPDHPCRELALDVGPNCCV